MGFGRTNDQTASFMDGFSFYVHDFEAIEDLMLLRSNMPGCFDRSGLLIQVMEGLLYHFKLC